MLHSLFNFCVWHCSWLIQSALKCVSGCYIRPLLLLIWMWCYVLLQLGANSVAREWTVWEVFKRGAECKPQKEDTWHQSALLHIFPPGHGTQVSALHKSYNNILFCNIELTDTRKSVCWCVKCAGFAKCPPQMFHTVTTAKNKWQISGKTRGSTWNRTEDCALEV